MLTKRDHDRTTLLIVILSFVVFGVLGAIGILVSCYRRRGHDRLVKQRRTMEAKTRGAYVKLDEEKGDVADVSVQLEERREGKRGDGVDADLHGEHAKGSLEAKQLVASKMAEKEGSRRESTVRNGETPEFSGLALQDGHGHGLFLPPPPVASYDSGRRQSSSGLRGSYDHNHQHGEDYAGPIDNRYDRSRSPSPGRLVLSRAASMLGPR